MEKESPKKIYENPFAIAFVAMYPTLVTPILWFFIGQIFYGSDRIISLILCAAGFGFVVCAFYIFKLLNGQYLIGLLVFPAYAIYSSLAVFAIGWASYCYFMPGPCH